MLWAHTYNVHTCTYTYVCMYVGVSVHTYVCMYVRCEPGVVSVSFLLLHCYSAQEGLVLATTSTRSNRRSSAPTQSWHLRRATRNSQASRVSRYTTLSHHVHWRPSHGTHRPRWARSSDSLWRAEGRGVMWVCMFVHVCAHLLHTYVRTYAYVCTHIHTYMHTYTCVHTYVPTYIRMYITCTLHTLLNIPYSTSLLCPSPSVHVPHLQEHDEAELPTIQWAHWPGAPPLSLTQGQPQQRLHQGQPGHY